MVKPSANDIQLVKATQANSKAHPTLTALLANKGSAHSNSMPDGTSGNLEMMHNGSDTPPQDKCSASQLDATPQGKCSASQLDHGLATHASGSGIKPGSQTPTPHSQTSSVSIVPPPQHCISSGSPSLDLDLEMPDIGCITEHDELPPLLCEILPKNHT